MIRMLGVSRRAGNWLAAVALVGAAVVLAMAACAAVMPAGAPGNALDGKAIHTTPAPQYDHHSPYIPIPYSLLLTTYVVDVVAHVKLKSVQGEVQQTDGSNSYWPVVRYEFDALEYLKGSGGNTLWGQVFVEHPAQSEEAARELAARYVQRIDPLHTGEAIVFMEDEESFLYTTRAHRKDHYYLGRFYRDWFSDIEATNLREDYSLAGLRRWLPLAASDGVSGASEEPQFMLRHPNGNYLGYYPEDVPYVPREVLNAAEVSGSSVIGLSELRHIAENASSAMEQGSREYFARRVGMAARNLTAEVVGDAVVLRWDAGTSPAAVDGVKGYRVFRQASVEGRPGFSGLQSLESGLVKLGDAAAASSRMSYVDRAGVLPGATYIYRVWTLEEDVYVFGEYGAEARVAIVAADGAKAAGEVVPVQVYY